MPVENIIEEFKKFCESRSIFYQVITSCDEDLGNRCEHHGGTDLILYSYNDEFSGWVCGLCLADDHKRLIEERNG